MEFKKYEKAKQVYEKIKKMIQVYFMLKKEFLFVN
jgi:hypothetical protein